MLALVLLRASSKQDALKMMWELSSLSEKRGVLPNMLTMLCMVRCCALLPCYAEVKKPFMVKEARYGLCVSLGAPYEQRHRLPPHASRAQRTIPILDREG
jgi:hypothetical protein